MRYRLCSFEVDFYPRPPRGGRQLQQQAIDDMDDISIHALREEGDIRKTVEGK